MTIIDEIIATVKSEKNGYCRIKHKRGWLGFLEDGDLVFKPRELHNTLRMVIDKEGNRPRGDRLFYQRKRYKYTAENDGRPSRPEEALERFLVVSNPENVFGQVPIGGGKESIDIGIKASGSKYIFVELKPWKIKNSPMYAIVENLKNLIEYRIIHERKIKIIPNYEVDLIILAPEAYYQRYRIIDDKGIVLADKISTVKKALTALSKEFKTKISFMALQLDIDSFLSKCGEVSHKRDESGKKIIISSDDSIPNLAIDKWIPIVDSSCV